MIVDSVFRKKEVRKHYDEIATKYDTRYTGSVRDLYKHEMKIFIENLSIKKGQTILELGAGTGRLFPELSKRKTMYVGIDFSKGIIGIARKKFSGIISSAFVICDAECLPFRRESFDRVLSVGMFEYINNPQKIIFEVSRVLKRSGKFALNVWSKTSPFRILYFLILVIIKHQFPRSSFSLSQIKNNIKISGLEPLKECGYFFIPPSVLGSLIKVFPLVLHALVIKCVIKFDEHAGANSFLKHVATNLFLLTQHVER